jgi:membrane fusion protein (multidrug efflux system)
MHSCQSKKKEVVMKTAPPALKVDGFVVKQTSLSKDIDVTGNLLPYEVTEVHPEISGLVTNIYFNEGSYVSAGKLLLTLRSDDLVAQLNKLYVQQKAAELTVKRYAELLKVNGVSQQEYDQNVLTVNTIKADIAILKTNIAKTRIVAPFSGIMGLRNISKGAYVTPATPISNLRQINRLKIEFNVPEVYSKSIRVGSPVTFTVQNSDQLFLANVIATENFIEQDNRSLKVRAVMAKADRALTAGQFAKVNIALDTDFSVYMIPSQAIIPQARTKEVIVLENGKASFRTVTTGIRDSSRVEVNTGLKAGDTIVITGLMSIKPGAAVSISNIKP